MKQPSKKQLNKRLKTYYSWIATIQQKCIGQISDVREFIRSQLPLIKAGESDEKLIYNYMKEKYTEMFLGMKEDFVNVYNESGKVEVNLVNETAGAVVLRETALATYAVLPNTKPFRITNRILSEKAVSIRSDRLAKQVTTLIGESFENELSIAQIQRKVDIAMGFRNSEGVITDKAKALIEQGKFSHRNGHIYQTYRIARTETMRMASIRQNEAFEKLEIPNKRMKLLAVIDSRTRDQSREMNGQISNEKGQFKYPDNKYYFLGEAPPEWSINDRETQYIVFI